MSRRATLIGHQPESDGRQMPHEWDAYIDAMASALDLRIEPDWLPAIRANVGVMAMARLVDDFKLPDDSEPASIYVA
jgi:hypothetical protein